MATNNWISAIGANWGATPGGANAAWSLGTTPNTGDDVTFDGTGGGDCTLNANAVCKSLDQSGMTGAMAFSGFKISTSGGGDVTLASGGTYSNVYLSIGGTGTLYSNNVECQKVTWTAGCNLTIDFGTLTVSQFDGSTATGLLTLDGFSNIFIDQVDGESDLFAKFGPSTTHAWNGFSLDFNIPGGVSQALFVPSSNTMGDINYNGAGGGVSLKVLTRNLDCLSFNQGGGEIEWASGIGHCAGDYNVHAGTLAGCTGQTFNIDGNFDDTFVGADVPGGTWATGGYFKVENGDATVLTSLALTVVGALSLKANVLGTITNMTGTCSSTAVAEKFTISGSNFSGGNDLTATTGCVDGGGNDAGSITFYLEATFDAETDGSTTDGSNWNPNGVPNGSYNVTIADSGYDMAGDITAHNITFTDFAMAYAGTLIAGGNVALAATMTAPAANINPTGAGSLQTSGVLCNTINLGVGSGIRTLLDNVALGDSGSSGSVVAASGSTLAMGVRQITIEIAEDGEDGLYALGSSLVTWSAGAKIIGFCGTPATETYFDLQNGDGDFWLPPVETTDVILYGNSALRLTSLLNTDGGIYWDSFDHEIQGNATFVGGLFTSDGTTPDGMVGRTLTVGGNLSFDGTAGVTGGTLAVTGALYLTDCPGVGVTATVGDNLVVDGSDLNGADITVSGSSADLTLADDIVGTDLDVAGNIAIAGAGALAESSLTFTGSAVVSGRTISGCTASGTVDCTGCTDGGGNDANFNFISSGPVVTGVTSDHANGSFGNGETIDIQVAFDDTVVVNTGGGAPHLVMDLDNGTRWAGYVSGSGTNTLTFSLGITAGDSSADLDYVDTTSLELNGGTIKNGGGDDADLTLPTPGAAGSLGANKAIVIDALAPTVTGVISTTSNGTIKAGAVCDVQATFDQAVTVTGTPRIAMNLGNGSRYANYLSGSGTATLTFRFTVIAGDTSADLDYVDANSLTLNSGFIGATDDGAPATLTLPTPGAAGSISDNQAIVVDALPPTVSGVATAKANGSYLAGEVIDLVATFNQAVTVTGSPRILMDVGQSTYANYLSGSGTSALTFRYTVAAGDNSSDLDYNGTGALGLNGGTINATDDGVPATLTLATPGASGSISDDKAIVIDTSSPTVTDLQTDHADGDFTTGEQINFQATTSESVTVTGTPRIPVLMHNDVVRWANYVSGSGSTTLVFRITALDSDFCNSLRVTDAAIDLNGGTITDGTNALILDLPDLVADVAIGHIEADVPKAHNRRSGMIR